MDATLQVLNDLVKSGHLERYAIGGAVAALYYLEPFLTEDLDIFCLIPDSASPLMPFDGIYQALKEKGYGFDGEFMMVEGVPVQFLPAATELEREALSEAAVMPYGDTVKTWVLKPEYLIALALQTGRDKDYERVARLLQQVKTLNIALVHQLVQQYALAERLQIFEKRYEDAAKLLDGKR